MSRARAGDRAGRSRASIEYHTDVARLNGATDAEIEDAVPFAKSSAGWSAYLNGMQVDREQFSGVSARSP